jgi:hypothetical protein
MGSHTAVEDKGSLWKPLSDPRAVHLGFVVDKVAVGQDSLSTSVSPCQYDTTTALYSFHSSISNTI